jgi:dCTP deaminase
MGVGSGCLVSQEIRGKIVDGFIRTGTNLSLNEQGRFADKSLEDRIQPSSFEPILGDEMFILDTETKGIFRPKPGTSVYKTLLELPARQRKLVDISNGFEIKKGFTYLLHLQDKLSLNKGEFIKSSPKSSIGRVFLNTRILADYNPCFDEIIWNYMVDRQMDLWALLQPQAFNLVVYPGITVNQLRFFSGEDAKLTPAQLAEEFCRNPLLVPKDDSVSSEPIITDALQIHLDLSGKYTEGIVGLRARHNPYPIDLSKTNTYEAEEFFEPVVLKEKFLQLKQGEYFLFSSKEILKMPLHINSELNSHSHVGFSGPLHFAGFIDNGFNGDLVFEVRSDELTNVALEDNMPISRLDVFRTAVPDKIYGNSIGSNYQQQVGQRPSKHFKTFDFKFAAKNYKKLDREVLVQDAKLLLSCRKNPEGLERVSENDLALLCDYIQDGFFHSRYDCEFDEPILQPIPYVIIFGPNNTVFSYVRTSNIQDYGDARLFGKHSVGVGGHIIKDDNPYYIFKCVNREVMEEEIEIAGAFSLPKLVGTLMQYDLPVDRVHLGLIFTMHVDGLVKPKENALISGRMVPIEEIIKEPQEKYETWSRVLIKEIENLQKF